MAKQDVRVELYYSGQWNDHTAAALIRGRIVNTRGRSAEGRRPAPTTCKLTFTEWRYNPSNVTSDLYGLIGRNTPLRVRYPSVAEGFEDATLDITIIDAPGSPDWARTTTLAHSGSWSLGAESVPLGNSTAVDITVPSGVNALTFWANVFGGSGSGLSVFVDGVEDTSGSVGVETPGWQQRTVGVPGATTVRMVYTPLFASGDAFIDDVRFDDVRFDGEVSSWTPRQSLGGPNIRPDRWVEVEAADPTRRLRQGEDPLRSALHRWLDGQSPDAWWPLDDPAGSRRGRSLVSGAPALEPSGESRYTQGGTGDPIPPAGAPSFGAGDLGDRMGDPFVSLTNGGELAVGMPDPDANRLTIEISMRHRRHQIDEFLGEGGSHTAIRLFMGSGSDFDFFDLQASVSASDPADFPPVMRWVATGLGLSGNWFAYDGQTHRYRVEMQQSGADTVASLYVDGLLLEQDTATGMTFPPVREIVINPLNDSGSLTPAVGHVVIWTGTPPSVTTVANVAAGHLGEHAGRRIARVADEEGIVLATRGDLDDTVPLGPQFPDTALEILRDAARTDGGDLTGYRPDRAVWFRTHRTRYNQAPALELDYDQEQVAPPLEPRVDDQRTRNDITARRRNGDEARRVDTDGPLGVNAVGRYPTTHRVNTLSDGHDLESQAGWQLNLGTVEGPRFPRITVDLTDGALAEAAGAVDLGDLITVANLPDELTPDLGRLLVLGDVETIGSHTRRITYVCAPEEPYHVAEVEHDDYAVIGAEQGKTTVRTAFASGTDTDLEVVNNFGEFSYWVFAPDADLPYDIHVAGVRLRVTDALTDGAPNFHFVVNQIPVNGVVKTIPVGAEVDVFHRSYIGL